MLVTVSLLLPVKLGGAMGVLEKVACDVIERPKMPRATWDALRAHVVRERKKKKEENQEVIFCRYLNLRIWRY